MTSLADLNQAVNNRFYRYLSRRATNDVQFFNWGYETDPPMAIPLDPVDEPNRDPIQLYHAVATQTGIAGKQVLEVGCGHGGGASYLTRYLNPASYTGLDLNAAGVEFCRRRHQVPGLTFVQGNAEDLPFPDASFDTVINVESSHCYPHLDRFLTEVARVLTPGGHFLYTDTRHIKAVDTWETTLAAAPLRKITERNIEAQVQAGISRNGHQWQPLIRSMPAWARATAPQWTPVPGSNIDRELRKGNRAYRMYDFTKYD